jgi:hypothetical protein
MLLSALLLAAPALALADDGQPAPSMAVSPTSDDGPNHDATDDGGHHDGPALGPARLASAGTVAKSPSYAGHLNPGRAATLLARQIRARGDQAQVVSCAMRSATTAGCTVVVDRGGARWTGNGEVRQGHRAFRLAYEIVWNG